MVGVEVGEDHERDPGHREVAQAPVDRTGVGSGVDDHARALPRHEHHRIALPHVFPVKFERVADALRRSGRRPVGDY